MELVTYHNDLNLRGYGNLTAEELEVFFYLIMNINNKSDLDVILTFREMKAKLNMSNLSDDYLINQLKSLSDKLTNIKYRKITHENKKGFIDFVLFHTISVNPVDRIVRIRVNEEALYLFNELKAKFSRIDFLIYLELKSKYSKEIYRKLRQFDKTKIWKITLKDFIDCLGVPENYEYKYINNKILIPAIKELKVYYPTLEVTPIYKKVEGARGRPKVHSLEFTFKENNYIIFNGQKINPDTGEIYEENSKPKLVTTIDKRIDELTEEELIELLMAKKAQKENNQSWITDETKSILNRNFLKE